jgi:hypothetical protein
MAGGTIISVRDGGSSWMMAKSATIATIKLIKLISSPV